MNHKTAVFQSLEMIKKIFIKIFIKNYQWKQLQTVYQRLFREIVEDSVRDYVIKEKSYLL